MSLFKRKYPLDEVYLDDFEPSQSWRLAGGAKSKQKSLGTEFVKFEPNTPLSANERPKHLVFELSGTRPLLCNNNFRFHIKAQMEKLKTVGDKKEWAALEGTNAEDLIFAPNWFEKLIAGVDIVVGNNKIQLHVENNDVAHELNALLYYLMSPELINHVAADPNNPVRYMPTDVDKNIQVGSAAHKTIGATMLGANPFSFSWLPLHMFPFWQTPNFELDRPQVDLPLHLLGKMFITIHFKPEQHHVWRGTANTFKPEEYRMNFKQFYLAAEENILPPGKIARPMQIHFPCVIRDSKCEFITAGETEHKIRFSNCPLPEQIVIFAIDKKVYAGDYKFQDGTYNTSTLYFKLHNLKELELLYNNQSFTSRTPNFEQFSGPMCTFNTLDALKKDGLFGVKCNEKKLPYNIVSNDFTDFAFPFCAVSYLLGNGTRQRRHPLNTDGTALKNDQDMELILRFNPSGATADSVYCIYFVYTDRAMKYDVAQNKFINPLKPYL